MRIGIFSDVHSNLEALERVLEFLRTKGVTQYLCCGDIVGYGPDPSACIERVRALRGTVVAGNHDYGVQGKLPIVGFNAAAQEALVWTMRQLGERDREYLDSLPLTEACDPFLLVHASPSAPEQWEYIFMLREAEEELQYFTADICLVGHSHCPFAVERRNNSPARLLHHDGFELRPDAKYLLNVGSVGQPRDGDRRACCLVYDTASMEMFFHRIEYDIEAVQRKILSAGLPRFLADRLAVGR